MRSVSSIADMKAASRSARLAEQKIAFVPTMGALHEGHLSLVHLAIDLADVVVMSIFVNPAQFGPGEDFNVYPRSLSRDASLAAEAGVDILFVPGEADLYPPGFSTWVEVAGVSDRFEGASRPGHFRGVATVVLKLFQIVGPDLAIFGQKDAQQTAIVKRLVRDLDLDVEIIVAPTLRESDGLAMSSRNVYLSPEERRAARALPRALERAQARVAEGETDPRAIAALVAREVASEPLAALDYAEVVTPVDFRPAESVTTGTLAIAAASFGTTRLIDNRVLHLPAGGGR